MEHSSAGVAVSVVEVRFVRWEVAAYLVAAEEFERLVQRSAGTIVDGLIFSIFDAAEESDSEWRSCIWQAGTVYKGQLFLSPRHATGSRHALPSRRSDVAWYDICEAGKVAVVAIWRRSSGKAFAYRQLLFARGQSMQ